MKLVNGAQACNVFWQVGSSATLGTTTDLAGNILALTSITMNNGVTLNGRALARNGAVTLINDTITAPHCAGELDVSRALPGRRGPRRQPGSAAERGRRGGARRGRYRPHALLVDQVVLDQVVLDQVVMDQVLVDQVELDGRGAGHRRAVGARDLDVRHVRERRHRRRAGPLHRQPVELGPRLVAEPSAAVTRRTFGGSVARGRGR